MENTKDGKMLKYGLLALNDSSRWALVKGVIADHDKNRNGEKSSSNQNSQEEKSQHRSGLVRGERGESDTSDEASIVSLSIKAEGGEVISRRGGTIVDGRREIRAKIYIGKIPMGWFWFVPAFHLKQNESSTVMRLVRKEVDFPLGPGEWIVDVEIGMEWVDDIVDEHDPSRVGQNLKVAKQKSAESDRV